MTEKIISRYRRVLTVGGVFALSLVFLGIGSIASAQTATTTGVLTVIKDVVNDDNGTSTEADFSLSVLNDSDVVVAGPDAGSAAGVSYTLDAGIYTVVEATSTDYTASFANCGTNGEVTVTAGATTTCTVINDDVEVAEAPRLTVTKVVINNDGATSTVADFTLTVGTTTVTSGVENTFATGTYRIAETGPGGYTASFSGDCDSDGDITLEVNGDYTCTITNNDIGSGSGLLTVRKVIVNDNGGTATTSSFTYLVAGTAGTTTVESGVQNTFATGSYRVSETGMSGYAATFSGDCDIDGDITVADGGTYECVITNNDLAPGQAQCSDSVDNDGDGIIDYPYDVGCESTLDNSEFNEDEPSGGGGGGSNGGSRRDNDDDDDDNDNDDDDDDDSDDDDDDNDNDDDSDDDDDGEVLGAGTTNGGVQTGIFPVGAPNTGFGGTASSIAPIASMLAILTAAGKVFFSRD